METTKIEHMGMGNDYACMTCEGCFAYVDNNGEDDPKFCPKCGRKNED